MIVQLGIGGNGRFFVADVVYVTNIVIFQIAIDNFLIFPSSNVGVRFIRPTVCNKFLLCHKQVVVITNIYFFLLIRFRLPDNKIAPSYRNDETFN